MMWFIIILVLIGLWAYGSVVSDNSDAKDRVRIKKKQPLKTNKRERFSNISRFLENDNVVFLDTETTGLGKDDEIIEISILDNEGNILLNTLVKPTIKIGKSASRIHGIKQKDVAKAPSWIDVYEDYLKCTEDKIILAYNAKFDKRMIQQSCKAHGLVNRRRQWDCVMFAYSEFMGNTKNGVYRWHKLVDAAFNCGVQINNAESGPHRALYDTGLAFGVHKFMKLEVEKFLNKN